MTSNDAERKPIVLRPSALPAHQRGGGASTTPLVGPAMGASAFINGITSFAPGAAIPFHSHNCEESVLLLEGEAILEIDGQQIRLQTLDTTWIPPNVPHRFRNLSKVRPMRIFWTYGRIDATRTLAESGQTRLIAAEYAGKSEGGLPAGAGGGVSPARPTDAAGSDSGSSARSPAGAWESGSR